MFTDMPSWVPLDCMPVVEQEFESPAPTNRFENKPPPPEIKQGELKRSQVQSETTQTEKPNYKLRVNNDTPSRTTQFMQRGKQQSYHPLQPRAHKTETTFTRLTMMQTKSFISKAQARVEKHMRTLAIHVARSHDKQSTPLQPLVARSLPNLPALPKALPKPMEAATLQEQRHYFSQKPAAKGERDLSHKMSTPTKSEKQQDKTELTTKRSLNDHFIFPINIRSDEREEQEGRASWHCAKRISKIKKGATHSPTPKTHTYSYKQSDDRPTLAPPRMGIFALYYILTKLGIISDATSHWETKKDIQDNQEALDLLHKERLAQLKKAAESENKSKRWGISTQIFSWMGSFTAIIAGVAMIMSGAGAVAGAMIMVSGLFALTNHIMMVTGGWDKICDRLPGDDPKKKKAIISWMQIGITVLCLALSVGGAYFGGFSVAGDAMSHFQAVFGGVMMFAGGISSIGQGITSYQYRDRLAESLKHKRKIEHRKHRQDDLYEKAEAGVERMKLLFKELSKSLDFEAELFRADQMALGR